MFKRGEYVVAEKLLNEVKLKHLSRARTQPQGGSHDVPEETFEIDISKGAQSAITAFLQSEGAGDVHHILLRGA